MLKNSKDVRSVFFMILTTVLFIGLWNFGPNIFNIYGENMISNNAVLNKWLFRAAYAWFLFMSVIVAVITHNHNHVAIWKNRFMNIFQESWLTVFYGFPIFAWIPTHNTNHHKHTNTEEDYTKTWRYTERNNLFTLLTYPTVSSKFQMGVVKDYYIKMFSISKKKFWFHTLQIVSLILWVAFFLILDWRRALLYVIIPQQVSTYSVLIFNYLQHVHADELHKFNNSRNFTGKFLNYWLLNNGIHLAHHMYPSQHWSDLPATHASIEAEINPVLNEKSYWIYLFRTYIVSLVIPKYKSKSLRVERMQAEQQNA